MRLSLNTFLFLDFSVDDYTGNWTNYDTGNKLDCRQIGNTNMECGKEDELQTCIVEKVLINCHSQDKDTRKGTFSKEGYIDWEDGTYWIHEGIENK